MKKTNIPDRNKILSSVWTIISIVALAAAGLAGTAFGVGIKYEEAKANLDATKALNDCSEKIEAEKKSTAEYKDKYFNSVKENILTAAENIKKEGVDAK